MCQSKGYFPNSKINISVKLLSRGNFFLMLPSPKCTNKYKSLLHAACCLRGEPPSGDPGDNGSGQAGWQASENKINIYNTTIMSENHQLVKKEIV